MERKSSYEMNEIDRKEKAEYFSQRDYLVEKDKRDYFVVDVDEFLDENEMVVEEKLQKLKFELTGKGKLPYLENFYDGKERIENSDLYKFLYSMPKGGLLHYHLTAAAPIDFLLSLTHEDIVYYNREKNKISINKDDVAPEGYILCNEIRKNWSEEGTFDEYLREKILLNRTDIWSQNSNQIWKNFQYKFDLTFQLYNYHHFFRRVLIEVLTQLINEKWYVVEFKHIFGCLSNDSHKMVDLKDELQIFEDWFAQIKEIEPTFKMKLVVCGLKIFGDEHINAQIKACLKGMKTTALISGFDLVNEEDTTPPLRAFRKMIKNTQQENPGFEIFLHAGESASRKNGNLYDAVLLNTKRLGHAFHLIDHPYLIEKVKERGICVEVCPVSNLILGYWYDLRWHPARSFLQRGIPMCINSDDPGFWGSTGVSLDFAYATIAWDLDLKELKQFAINAIKYSTLAEAEKEEVFNKFYDSWSEWILSLAK